MSATSDHGTPARRAGDEAPMVPGDHRPPIVLIHGWGLHGGIWSDLLAGLDGFGPALTPDLPGHGHAAPGAGGFELDDVADGLAAGIPPGATVLGWSLGAMVALTLARRHPDRVERLILVSATPRFTQTNGWDCGISDSVFDVFARFLMEDYRQTLNRFLSLQVRGGTASRETLRRLRALLYARGEPVPGALAGGLEILRCADLRPWLGEIEQPAQVIAGLRDRLVPAEASRRLAAALPNARFDGLEDAGHAPFISHRETFLAALAAGRPALTGTGA